jgi:hypothetical protein
MKINSTFTKAEVLTVIKLRANEIAAGDEVWGNKDVKLNLLDALNERVKNSSKEFYPFGAVKEIQKANGLSQSIEDFNYIFGIH